MPTKYIFDIDLTLYSKKDYLENTDDEKSYDWQKRNLKAALDKEPIEAIEENVIKELKKL